jgi:hypothetical protein
VVPLFVIERELFLFGLEIPHTQKVEPDSEAETHNQPSKKERTGVKSSPLLIAYPHYRKRIPHIASFSREKGHNRI